MKKERGESLAIILLVVVLLLTVFYILTFFLRFQISDFTGISLCFLAVLVVLSSFTGGVFFTSRKNLPASGSLLVSLAVLGVFLFTLTLISSAGTNIFAIVSFALLPFLLLHLFILGLYVKIFLNKRVDTGAMVAKIVTPYGRRDEARIKDYISAQFLSNQGDWEPIKVYDFSAQGMRLIAHRPFHDEEMLDLKIIIPYDSRPVFAKAKVIWAKEFNLAEKEFHAGVQFMEIDPTDKVRLMLKQVYSLFQDKIT